MKVELTPDQRAFVRDAMAQGRVRSEEQAVQQAMALWEARERRRAEILADVAEAEAALAAGQGRPISDESMRALADDVKRRGRERLSLETTG
jgi:Arc/MetJ-type ribon-helix-helix transcriptional regulator